VRVDFGSVLMQLLDPDKPMMDGVPPAEGEEDQRKPLTLRIVVCNALMALDPQAKMEGVEKAKRYELAMRVVGFCAGETGEQFKVEEIALMKKVVGESFGPIVVGPAFKMLDAAEGDKTEADGTEKVAGAVPAKE